MLEAFTFDYKNIILLLIVFCNLFLGFFVLYNGIKRKERINFYYFILSLAVVLWAVGMIMWRGSFAYEDKLIWVRWLYAFATLIPTSFVFFCYNFPDHEVKFGWRSKVSVLLLNYVFVIISVFPGGVVRDVYIRVFQEDQIVFGSLYALYNIYIPAIFLWGFYVLWRKYKVSKSIKKMQIKYVFYGTFIPASLGMVSNLILPTFDVFDFNWLGQALTLVMVAFIAYAIVRYRLMDIKVVLTKSLLYFFLVLFVAVSFTFLTMLLGGSLIPGLDSFQRNALTFIVSLVVVLGLDPLKKILTKVTEKIFFKGKIDHDAVLHQSTEIISQEINLKTLVSRLTKQLVSEMKLANFDIFLEGLNKKEYVCLLGSKKAQKVFTKNKIVGYLSKTKIPFIAEELEYELLKESKPNIVAGFADKYNASVVVPILGDRKMLGFFLVGKKLSREGYDNKDLTFYSVIASQFSSALIKAQLYQESLRFGEKLKKEVKRATSDLREANDKLKVLDKSKTEFLSIASHQLRTPLTSVRGYLSMILDGDFGKIPKGIKQTLDDVFFSTDRLIRLVNVFLNISRIESGRLKLVKVNFDIVELSQRLVRQMQTEALKKKLKLSFESSLSVKKVNADPDKLTDVILNFIDNAIKYTADGFVKVSLSGQKGKIRLEVLDSGVGVEKREAGRLFSKFVRSQRSTKINTSGSGLGLFVVKTIVELHKGKVWVESEGADKGSKFVFEIPVDVAKK